MYSRNQMIARAKALHAAHLRVKAARAAGGYGAAYAAAKAELAARGVEPRQHKVRAFVRAAAAAQAPAWVWHTTGDGRRQRLFCGPLLFDGRAFPLFGSTAERLDPARLP